MVCGWLKTVGRWLALPGVGYVVIFGFLHDYSYHLLASSPQSGVHVTGMSAFRGKTDRRRRVAMFTNGAKPTSASENSKATSS